MRFHLASARAEASLDAVLEHSDSQREPVSTDAALGFTVISMEPDDRKRRVAAGQNACTDEAIHLL